MRTLPLIAVMLGAAGLIPFVLASLGALALEAEGARMSLLALSAYGAVILSFLGGVHWGFGLQEGGAQTVAAQRSRFGLGVVPALIGWAALLVTFVGLPKTGLIVLISGFGITTLAESRATKAGLLPTSYMLLRWVLSLAVIVCLISVTVVLAFGGRVVL